MAAIILAGGLSARMGTDKALLDVGGSTILQSLVARFAQLGPVIVVMRRDRPGACSRRHSNPRCVWQARASRRPARRLSASPDEVNFLLACDMPFANPGPGAPLSYRLDDHDAACLSSLRGRDRSRRLSKELPGRRGVLHSGRMAGMRDSLEMLDVQYLSEDELRARDAELRSFSTSTLLKDYLDMLYNAIPSSTEIFRSCCVI